MPQEEGGLKGIYYGISDKAWSLAEWTESKGIPIASFCEKYHLNPILLFGIILLAIILLVVFYCGNCCVATVELIKALRYKNNAEGNYFGFSKGGLRNQFNDTSVGWPADE